jgi:cell division septation protein DedD
MKEKYDLSLDNRQVMSLLVGSLVVLGAVFVLGVVVGKQLGGSQQASAAPDLLTALDAQAQEHTRTQEQAALTFPDELVRRTPGALDAGSRTGDAPAVVTLELPVPRPAPSLAQLPARDDGDAAPADATDAEAPARDADATPGATALAAKAEPAKAEPVKVESVKVESVKVEVARAEAARPAPKAAEKVAAKAEPAKQAPAKPAPAKPALAKAPAPAPVVARAVASTAQPSATPARAAAPTGTSADGAFSLQLSASQSRAEADRFVAKLRERGYAPFIVQAAVEGKGTWYRVRMGRFGSKEAAARYLADFKRETRLDAFVTPTN